LIDENVKLEKDPCNPDRVDTVATFALKDDVIIVEYVPATAVIEDVVIFDAVTFEAVTFDDVMDIAPMLFAPMML
jgi:hypothetical protein